MQNPIRSLMLALVLVLALQAMPAHAQQTLQPEARQALVMTAVNTTAVREADRGNPRPDSLVQRGDVVQYRLLFSNVTEKPLRQIVLSNPIPAGFYMVPGSVHTNRDDVRNEYSADGGKVYAAQPMEEVLLDGKRVQRPISPDRYTHVRWTVDGWVEPKATVTADFDARLAVATPAAGAAAEAEDGSDRK
jgi:uncharacterized repeat protein (TIGR01451 family)